MATTNAKFVDELKLSRSSALAEKLSIVLGVWVGFHSADGGNIKSSNAPWSDSLKHAIYDAIEKGPSAFHADGYEVAIAPFDRQNMHLVLVRESRSLMATGLGDTVLFPTLLLTIACSFLAYYLARRIVHPLSTLTSWLPHLEHDDRAAPAIAQKVSARSDEIGELARSLETTHNRLREEQMRRRQSERMATLGRIATSLAHEIRNPASSIGLHANLLARDANRSHSQSIALIQTEVGRITDLVNQWLFVVRPAPPQLGKHDLAALVARIGESLRAAMEHAGASLHIAEMDNPLPVRCDHARIEQVVRNLLVNAIQAMPDGGIINVSFNTTGKYAVLLIRDSGPGFSKEALKHFGEPFFSEREGGMGIGLTLAREVIEAHNGHIFATNFTKSGAEVKVQLPLT